MIYIEIKPYGTQIEKRLLSLSLTDVCTIIARWSRIFRTISSGYTGWFLSIKHIAVSIATKTPVRPIPALQDISNITVSRSHCFTLKSYAYFYIFQPTVLTLNTVEQSNQISNICFAHLYKHFTWRKEQEAETTYFSAINALLLYLN